MGQPEKPVKQGRHLQTEEELLRYKEIIELLYDGVVVVDAEGIITMISQKYCDFLQIPMRHAVGRHVSEVIENTRMHVILKTGHAEFGSVQKVMGRDMVVMRIPIKKEGQVVGAVGKVMFADIHDLKTLAQRLNIVESKLDYYKSELKRVQGAKYSFDQIVGEHEKMLETKKLASRVSKSRSTVLIRGESGTGKEWFAHAIHEASPRAEGPFIRVNCAAIPNDLMEAELFGYEEGAFTGAKKGGKPGKIELAQGGTLFLDEIGDMPLNMQAKLLRVIQEKEVERIGGVQVNSLDIRIITATHRPLEELVKKGDFREDLYYRLNVFHITIPPLRERGLDILTTAQYILGKLNHEHGTSITGFHPSVEELFLKYRWPGNVREMQNIIERSIHMSDQSHIRLEHLPPYLVEGNGEEYTSATFVLEKELERAELRVIQRALKETEGNRAKAAKLLGIHRASLYRKMEKYRLTEGD
jgi:transcriptional regulator with PAS, ATPase and Fis domain